MPDILRMPQVTIGLPRPAVMSTALTGAVIILSEMATFEDAGVSGKE